MRKLINLIESQQSVEVKLLTGENTLEWISDHDADKAASEIRYFFPQYARTEVHVLVLVGGELAAMGGFEINPRDPKQLWVKFISTRPAFLRRGFARIIYETIYPWAVRNKLKIAPGSLSTSGALMVHIHDEMYDRYPDAAYARDQAGNYINDKGQIVRSADRTPVFGKKQ